MRKKIIHAKDKTGPTVMVVACLHGDELIGKKVIKALKKIKIKKGALITIIGNEKAVKMKRRFTDQDLNRSFPGKESGNHEERLAYALKNKISNADYVIDIHSTTTVVRDLAIITKKNKKTLELLDLFAPKMVALVNPSIGRKALTYYCKAGISLEYGKDKDKLVYDKILRDIVVMLKKLEMIDFNIKATNIKPELYEIVGTIKKQDEFEISGKIKNFKLVKRGNIVASKGIQNILAGADFYPILFGENSYNDIYGFAAKKVEKF